MTLPKNIEKSERRRLKGYRINSSHRGPLSVTVLYARTYDIDGFIIEALEEETISANDFVKVKAGSATTIRQGFSVAISSALYPMGEVARCIDLLGETPKVPAK